VAAAPQFGAQLGQAAAQLFLGVTHHRNLHRPRMPPFQDRHTSILLPMLAGPKAGRPQERYVAPIGIDDTTSYGGKTQIHHAVRTPSGTDESTFSAPLGMSGPGGGAALGSAGGGCGPSNCCPIRTQ
jgi:hypothetical protein